ncbi:FliH/SctL family protein [Paraburkholderia sp. BCC1884]|uniref:FliH/SctL family protein n=1 Tax=Paraburkholderia sp. BCC1884 TaxID=2562668 RepID=UPI001183DB73|nr:FliH/SctL family protein [Paraburkholderia sp. BCC1884]
MLICRMGNWRIESDGHLSGHELMSLEGLQAAEAQRAAQAADQRARLEEQGRALKRRAWRHGHAAGKLAALRECAAREAATLFAAHRLEQQLAQIVLDAVTDIVGEMPPSVPLTNQLRRAIAVAQSQRLISVRVAPSAFDDATHVIAAFERELGVPLCAVLVDAQLPPHSCVIETEAGVIDGGLQVQLRALEHGIRDGVAAVLSDYDFADGAGHSALDPVRHELRQTLALLATPVASDTPRKPPSPSTSPGAASAQVVQRPFSREAA